MSKKVWWDVMGPGSHTCAYEQCEWPDVPVVRDGENTCTGGLIHHNDYDRTNNDRENLAPMHRGCHARHHHDMNDFNYAASGDGLRVPKSDSHRDAISAAAVQRCNRIRALRGQSVGTMTIEQLIVYLRSVGYSGPVRKPLHVLRAAALKMETICD